jgi:hypothetical protein
LPAFWAETGSLCHQYRRSSVIAVKKVKPLRLKRLGSANVLKKAAKGQRECVADTIKTGVFYPQRE